ncbi:MAG: Gfo/Idh/MocA family oxidoreductase [Phycisphaeraceae bacterium]|nr:Gfo/Idh/MocA family oxidoreductase [Phycisphaeraceae bacterium]
MKTVRFGIIGAGLMGREFASAAARWCQLSKIDVKPQLVAICDKNPAIYDWYKQNFPDIKLYTDDHHKLLDCAEVEAVYAAVPHNLHQAVYGDIISAGKHLMGEKPFGIDLAANTAILDIARANPRVFVRCSSQMPFYPAVQKVGQIIESGQLGQIIEVETGFLHSSDMDVTKPINWKRMIEINGEYGVLGDLGMHACHVPFRAGWRPRNVRAVLSDIVKTRPDGKGGMAPCKTWDNGILLCEMEDPATEQIFPWTFKSFRIAPGEKNTWYVRVYGTKTSVRFTTKNPKLLEIMVYKQGEEQVWQQIDMGMDTAFASITGGIFEFGFSDAVQQMWAGFLYELHHGKPITPFAGCVKLEEAAMSHRLFTAALKSQRENSVVTL